MSKILLSLALIIFSNSAICQLAAEQNTGKLFHIITNNEASGSPFLYDDWKSGSVILSNENKLDNLKLKFDVLHNKFLFNRNDSTYEFADDVKEIRIMDEDEKEGNKQLIFEKVINANDKILAGTFVQVLSAGKITLLKYISKRIEGENFTNGIITSKKQIVSHNSYWVTVSSKTTPVKLNSHSLEELTSDKKDEMQKFVKAAKLNAKNEKDFALAIAYYNSISTSQKK